MNICLYKTSATLIVLAAMTTSCICFSKVGPESAHAQTFDSIGDHFKVGGWEGGSQFLDDGQFFSCLMVASYGGDRTAAFGINKDYSFWFGLSSREWEFSRSAHYRITYMIDSHPPVTLPASAPFPTMMMADFIDNIVVFQQLLKAHTMTVDIEPLQEKITLNLDNIDNALPELASCVEKNLGAEGAHDIYRKTANRSEKGI